MEQTNRNCLVQSVLTDHRWLTIELLEPGMILARPVVAAAHGVLSMKLGEGSELTASMISQMSAHGIECVAIAVPPPTEDDAWRTQGAAYAQRLNVIFCDSQAGIHPDCQPLYDLLQSQGPLR